MWNVVENGDVGMWRITFDVECGGERWCEIWWITLTWNVAEKDGVEYGVER